MRCPTGINAKTAALSIFYTKYELLIYADDMTIIVPEKDRTEVIKIAYDELNSV